MTCVLLLVHYAAGLIQCSKKKETSRPETGPEFPQIDKNPKLTLGHNAELRSEYIVQKNALKSVYLLQGVKFLFWTTVVTGYYRVCLPSLFRVREMQLLIDLVTHVRQVVMSCNSIS